jgi:hypothetical protein
MRRWISRAASGRTLAAAKATAAQNPKAEIRNPKETRNPKSEGWAGRTPLRNFRPSDFGFRVSDFARLARLALLCLAVWLTPSAPAAAPATNGLPSRNIGIEGSISVALPKPGYRPRPLSDRTELILRLDGVTPLTNGQHRYDFYYIGLEPGPYNLADYLMRPDGSRPEELGNIRIQVRALLPDDHNGQLNTHVPRLFPWIGGYRVLLGVIAVIWVGGLAAFIWAGRKKRAVAAPVVTTPPPSLAELMRPLVDAAATGKITSEGQARLERLLMGYWREKLNLPDLRMAEALLRLKAHAEAGALLRALERWLHRPGGASPQEVAALLEPYRCIPAPTQLLEGGRA